MTDAQPCFGRRCASTVVVPPKANRAAPTVVLPSCRPAPRRLRTVSDERAIGSSTTREFFRALRARGYEPTLADVAGSVCFEIVGSSRSDHWLVEIDEGHLAVAERDGDADCRVRIDEELFEKLVRGDANAMAGALRGSAVLSGDLELLLTLPRIFPGPKDQERPSPIGRSSRWTP